MAPPQPEAPHQDQPSGVRHQVVLSMMLVSMLLYLDRFCISFAEIYIKQDLGLSDSQVALMLSAFFWSYALAQVPSGWLSDRFGGRVMLAIYVLGWSLFTGLTGFAVSFIGVLALRLAFGVFQAGAYPTAALLVSKWVPFSGRGTASSLVAVGGRFGGALAMLLTAYLIAWYVPTSVSSKLASEDLLRTAEFCHYLKKTAAPALPTDKPDETEQARRRFSERVLEGFSGVGRAMVDVIADKYAKALAAENERIAAVHREAGGDESAAPKPLDRLPLDQSADLARDPQRAQVAEELNHVSSLADFHRAGNLLHLSAEKEAMRYAARIKEGETLAVDEIARLNRLVLEAVYPDYIRRIYVHGWRTVMWTYGTFGLLVAGVFWCVLRNRPADHARCNAAERALIELGRPPEATRPDGKVRGVPLAQLLTSTSMWLVCLSQFFTNAGWIFLVTWSPRYLATHHHVPVETRGMMTFLPVAVGWFGMLAGGRLTDRLVRLVGLRWGRALPMSLSRFIAMAAYMVVIYWYMTTETFNPWIAVACFAVVAFATDLGTGAVWAFKQDVGGRYVGSILGWGNMWGNLGAAIFIWLLAFIAGEGPDKAWDLVFITCAASFFLSGVAAIGVNATIPIAPPDEDDD